MLNLRIKLDERRHYMFTSFEQETNDNSGKNSNSNSKFSIFFCFLALKRWLANRCLKEQKLFCSEIFNMVLFCKFQPAFIEHA